MSCGTSHVVGSPCRSPQHTNVLSSSAKTCASGWQSVNPRGHFSGKFFISQRRTFEKCCVSGTSLADQHTARQSAAPNPQHTPCKPNQRRSSPNPGTCHNNREQGHCCQNTCCNWLASLDVLRPLCSIPTLLAIHLLFADQGKYANHKTGRHTSNTHTSRVTFQHTNPEHLCAF